MERRGSELCFCAARVCQDGMTGSSGVLVYPLQVGGAFPSLISSQLLNSEEGMAEGGILIL